MSKTGRYQYRGLSDSMMRRFERMEREAAKGQPVRARAVVATKYRRGEGRHSWAHNWKGAGLKPFRAAVPVK